MGRPGAVLSTRPALPRAARRRSGVRNRRPRAGFVAPRRANRSIAHERYGNRRACRCCPWLQRDPPPAPGPPARSSATVGPSGPGIPPHPGVAPRFPAGCATVCLPPARPGTATATDDEGMRCCARPRMREEQRRMLLETRARRPAAIAEAAAARRRPSAPVDDDGRAMIIAADHTARGILGAGRRADAMADRIELLDRIRACALAPGRDRRHGLARHPRGPAAPRRPRRQGRVRVDEPRRPAGGDVGDRRPLHRLRRRRDRRGGLRGRQDARPHRSRGRRDARDARGVRPRGLGPRRPRPRRDGRAVHGREHRRAGAPDPAAGRRDPRVGRRRRARARPRRTRGSRCRSSTTWSA